MLKEEGQLTKRQELHTTNTSTGATYTSSTATVMIGENIVSIATTCKVKSIKMKISKST
jgi:hypothetical protein